MTDEAQNSSWSGRQLDRRRFLKTSAGVAAGAAAGAAALGAPFDAYGAAAESAAKSKLGPAPKQLSGSLTVAFFGAADIVKAWEPIFNTFRRIHPKVNLELVPIAATDWTTYADSAMLQMAGGKQFDVLQAAVNVQRLFISKNVVQPLDAYLARDHKQLASYLSDEYQKFFQWGKTLVSGNGSTYYLPADFNTNCMWVNTKMFKDAGLPVPADGWTWDDLMAAGPKIATSSDTFLIDLPADTWDFQPWALTNGSDIMTPDWTKSTMSHPKTVAAAKFVQSLCVKGYAPKPSATGTTFDPVTEFANDKLAIFSAGAWLNPSVKAAGAAGKAKIVAWPKKVREGTTVGWNAYSVVKSSKNKEAAWAFLKYLNSAGVTTTLTKSGQANPGRKSIWFKYVPTAAPEQNVKELWTSLSYATPTPSPNASDAITLAAGKTLTQIYNSSSDPTPLLKALDQQIDTLNKA
ncbi:MAG TPA: sugar ABC transporter substrate-binding protein [Solirubrobacteraceae bacterium]|jgi:ABC-type glycerol-3-phosphate transport system substrate-binding protein|nr:sugar ABC transporter substrate-binding protein [Solirubrobacteraceae bacterium]